MAAKRKKTLIITADEFDNTGNESNFYTTVLAATENVSGIGGRDYGII